MFQRPIVRVGAAAGLAASVMFIWSPAGAEETYVPPAEEPRPSCAAEPPPGALVSGPTEPNSITGTQADDVIYITGPNKTVYALAGNDLICANYSAGSVIVDAGEGNDKVYLDNDASDVVYGGPGNDMLHTTGGDDRVYGDAGIDRLFAGRGQDFVSGGYDNDQIRGGAGADALYGDEGHDYCQGDSEWDSANNCEQSAQVEQASG